VFCSGSIPRHENSSLIKKMNTRHRAPFEMDIFVNYDIGLVYVLFEWKLSIIRLLSTNQLP
jgi:hypothetical protein